MKIANQARFLEELETKLTLYYTPPACPGGHDVLHVKSMIVIGPEIVRQMKDHEGKEVDLFEYEAACWMHNIDRPAVFKNAVTALGKEAGLEMLCQHFLQQLPPDAIRRITDVVKQHPKFKDDLGKDTPLLTAIRIADKVVRLGPDGIVSAAAFRGPELPAYDSKLPFGYASTVEGKLKTVYNDFMRVLEWVEMLPYDWARGLIKSEDLCAYIAFVRAYGRMMADRLGVPNSVEDDLKKALGAHYDR